MRDLLITGLLVVLCVGVNSTLVYMQKINHFYDKLFGKRGLVVHGVIIIALWVGFFSYVTSSIVNSGNLSNHLLLLIIASFAGVLSAYLFITSLKLLGPGSLVNANFFVQKKQKVIIAGIFRYLDNPMYISFELYIVSLALFYEAYPMIVAALLLFIGLNVIQARVERI